MTKSQFVSMFAEQTKKTERQAEAVIDATLNGIMAAVARGDKVEIRGFGVFTQRIRKAKQGRNPKTGAVVNVPMKKVPCFKSSKELKDRLNPSDSHGTSPSSS